MFNQICTADFESALYACSLRGVIIFRKGLEDYMTSIKPDGTNTLAFPPAPEFQNFNQELLRKLPH